MELNINSSISDIISEISKKDKKRQVFILTSLIKDLKNTRIEAKSNYEDCNASYTRRTDNFLGHFNLMIWKKQLELLDMIIENLDAMIVKDGELWIVLLVICVILLKINLILN